MQNNLGFQKLTPTDAIDLDIYDEAMQFVFDNPDIRNIAISGSYGAGKSSLIETYKKKHTEYQFLGISLAHFTENSKEEKCDAKKSEDEVTLEKKGTDSQNKKGVTKKTSEEIILEGKIINQLVQQIEEKKIPKTNFSIKRKHNEKDTWISVLGIILFLLSVFYIGNYGKILLWVSMLRDTFLKPVFQLLTSPYSLLFAGAIAVLVLGYWLYGLIYRQRIDKVFRKISFQGNEIALFSEEDNSYFDKYLNEVLYLFEYAGVDAIVFEDIDRFNSVAIFERLREINRLVNIRLKEEKRVLRFFYLLRDDIFVSKERTKFFDYILPVIPVVGNSNSYNKLKENLTGTDMYKSINDKFLRRLSLYVDDMRLLNNICNEFIIYFKKLIKVQPDSNKMLAIITYKNLFPKDFSELQSGRGYVGTLFSKKDKFVEGDILRCDGKIEEIKKEIALVSKEHLQTVKELEAVKQSMLSEVNQSNSYSIRTQRQQEYDRWILEDYATRKKRIEDGKSNVLINLNERLDAVQKERDIIHKKTLAELLIKENEHLLSELVSVNELGKNEDTFNEVKSSEYYGLLIFLLSEGYIDENYSDYLNHFYPNSLSVSDKVFLRSVTEKKGLEWDYSLENIPLVMEHFDIYDFGCQEILNFDLVSYLLENGDEEELLVGLLQQLKKNKTYAFICEYYKVTNKKARFVEVLNRQWPSYFEESIESCPARHVEEYAVDTLLFTPINILKEVNNENILSDYISSNGDIIVNHGEEHEVLVSAFLALGVSFKELPAIVQGQNHQLFDKVYKENLYEINMWNVDVILADKYNCIQDESQPQYISTIFSRPEEPLCIYVKSKMGMFIECMAESDKEHFYDESKDVVVMLNLLEGTYDALIKYLSKLQVNVEHISRIDYVQHRKAVLDAGKIAYTEDNILELFATFGLSEQVVEFINQESGNLDFTVIKDKTETKADFWDACVVCNELDNAKYTMILTTILREYEIFDDEGISDEKMRILFKEKIIPMNEESLQFIRIHYSSLVMKYIKENMDDYLRLASTGAAEVEEVRGILSWDIDEESKIRLLSEIEEEIAVTDMDYDESIVSYILNNNYSPDDLPYLCQQYDEYSVETQKRVIGLVKRNLEKVVPIANEVSTDFLYALLEASNNADDRELLVEIVIEAMGNLNCLECKKCLELLGMTEIAKVLEKNRRPNIAVGELNYMMLNAMKERGFIVSFVEDKEKSVYKVERGIVCENVDKLWN